MENEKFQKDSKVFVSKKSLENGDPLTVKNAKKHLKAGNEYTVERSLVRRYDTIVWLREFPGIKFNPISFVEE